MGNRSYGAEIVLGARQAMNLAGLRSRKVFAIGFNKSGTSSLHHLFRAMGRPSYHGVEWRGCDDARLLKRYDCFSDGIPRSLEALDENYPGARFILQVRDLEPWIYSRLAHIEREVARGIGSDHPYWTCTREAVKSWVVQRNTYHLLVLDYFGRRRDDLLVVNYIRDREAAQKIAAFLGYEGRLDRPKKNTNPKKARPPAHVHMVNEAFDELGVTEEERGYDLYCPSMVGALDRGTHPPDTSALAPDTGARAFGGLQPPRTPAYGA